MDWNDIKLLVEIGRLGTFTAAAAALGVSKATVTRRVSELEALAGTSLFRRTPMGAELTPIGEAALLRASRVDHEVTEFRRWLGELRETSQTVTIKASEGVAAYLLMPLLAGQHLGPLGVAGARVGVTLPQIRLISPAAAEPSDIRILWTTPGDLPKARPADHVTKAASITFIPFHSDALKVGERGGVERFDDLHRSKIITLDDYAWFNDDRALGQWNRVAGRANTVIRAPWTASMGHLTADGAGISLLPSYSTLYSPLLKPLPIAVPDMRADLWLAAGEVELRDRSVRSCFDGLVRVFREAEWMS